MRAANSRQAGSQSVIASRTLPGALVRSFSASSSGKSIGCPGSRRTSPDRRRIVSGVEASINKVDHLPQVISVKVSLARRFRCCGVADAKGDSGETSVSSVERYRIQASHSPSRVYPFGVLFPILTPFDMTPYGRRRLANLRASNGLPLKSPQGDSSKLISSKSTSDVGNASLPTNTVRRSVKKRRPRLAWPPLVDATAQQPPHVPASARVHLPHPQCSKVIPIHLVRSAIPSGMGGLIAMVSPICLTQAMILSRIAWPVGACCLRRYGSIFSAGARRRMRIMMDRLEWCRGDCLILPRPPHKRLAALPFQPSFL